MRFLCGPKFSGLKEKFPLPLAQEKTLEKTK